MSDVLTVNDIEFQAMESLPVQGDNRRRVRECMKQCQRKAGCGGLYEVVCSHTYLPCSLQTITN